MRNYRVTNPMSKTMKLRGEPKLDERDNWSMAMLGLSWSPKGQFEVYYAYGGNMIQTIDHTATKNHQEARRILRTIGMAVRKRLESLPITVADKISLAELYEMAGREWWEVREQRAKDRAKARKQQRAAAGSAKAG